MQSDCELVNAVLEGDKSAFEELVVRYERATRAVCLNVLNDRHLAADAAQEAFVSAYRSLGMLHNAKTFAPWLMQIAKRCSLDILRSRHTEAMGGSHRKLDEELTPGMAGRGDPCDRPLMGHVNGDNHQLDEEKQILLAAVMQLGDGEREAIMLRYFDDRSVQEVADIMGKGVGTITKQLSRAHAKLKNILERTYMEAQK